MAGLCEGGNEPPGSLKASNIPCDVSVFMPGVTTTRASGVVEGWPRIREVRGSILGAGNPEAFHGFLSYFQANAGIVPLESPDMDGDPSLNPFIYRDVIVVHRSGEIRNTQKPLIEHRRLSFSFVEQLNGRRQAAPE
ncbi:hypothetical protein ANN_23640 [Periplaneta americana]|uniref:Per a allergen n=1 Tax=Periplaneta americana TaxID=6978 RepID=A0ABQ8SMX1_PERAM|nr:hypothetical protein ANN_23640 [Periplaneta americana]